MKKTILFGLAIIGNSMAFGYSLDPVLDRKLTSQEMQVLLPAYVASIESNIESLPSPEDDFVLNSINASSTITSSLAFDKNGQIVGNKFVSITEKIEELEHLLGELKGITKETRTQTTREALEGFVSPSKRSRISCHLGYTTKSSADFKTKTDRIVVCKDDRSYSGAQSPDGEGYSDVREFIISIDSKTLQPISPLKVTHFTAG